MHFHLPKPLHGWREFLGKVGIIVVGVLMALAAEQVLSSIHERDDVIQLRVPCKASCEFARADRYVVNDLVTRWHVREWTTVVGHLAATPVRPAEV